MSRKDTIYVDTEDDITAIIDKLKAAGAPIAAIVLPKRSPVLQSVVNMKLLKKAAEDAKKKIVLITNESSLLPLAGSVGLHVAETLKSRPAVPKVDDEEVAVDESVIEGEGTDVPEDQAGAAAGDEPDAPAKDKKAAAKDAKKAAPVAAVLKKGGKRPKVPNFNSFKKRLVLGGTLGVLLIGGLFFANYVMPTARITLEAQTSRLDTEVAMTLLKEGENDLEKRQLVAEFQELKRTVTEEYTATGQKDVGTKASGKVTLVNCEDSRGIEVPKGAALTDPTTGLIFFTDYAVFVEGSGFDRENGEFVCDGSGKASVDVTASEGGDQYNLAPRKYQTSGLGDIRAQGDQMSGGTSKVVTVVDESDIQAAREAALAVAHTEQRQKLQEQFGAGALPLVQTFAHVHEEPVVSKQAGEEAEKGTVTVQYVYTMYGIPNEELTTLVETEHEKKLAGGQLSILDNGLKNADVDVEGDMKGGSVKVVVKAVGQAGPKIDTAVLAQEVAGKRYGAVLDTINSKPGLKAGEVDLSPFWVSKAPRASKITIDINTPDGQ